MNQMRNSQSTALRKALFRSMKDIADLGMSKGLIQTLMAFIKIGMPNGCEQLKNSKTKLKIKHMRQSGKPGLMHVR